MNYIHDKDFLVVVGLLDKWNNDKDLLFSDYSSINYQLLFWVMIVNLYHLGLIWQGWVPGTGIRGRPILFNRLFLTDNDTDLFSITDTDI